MSEDKYVLARECDEDVKSAHAAGLYTGALLGFMVGAMTLIFYYNREIWTTILQNIF